MTLLSRFMETAACTPRAHAAWPVAGDGTVEVRLGEPLCRHAPCLVSGMTFHLTSPSFDHEEAIPTRHTCEGEDVSPALVWSSPPPGTKSFALIVDDPDAPDPRAPRRIWVHWVIYDLPADTRSLAEGTKRGTLPSGALEGENDWGQRGWRGPCPPIGRHRYFFKLYALDRTLEELGGGATKSELEEAMSGHVLGTTTMIGTYAKKH